MLFHLLYNLLLPFAYFGLRIAALFDEKLSRTVRERSGLFERLKKNISYPQNQKRIWFHSTSFGEFEQAKPVMERLKKSGNYYIVSSVFSPTIYERAQKFPYADCVTYLPFDFPHLAQRFIDIVKPDILIVVKFDVWPNHLITAKRKKVLTFLIDGTLSPRSRRLSPGFKPFFRYVFSHFALILSVSASDTERFRNLVPSVEVQTIGDTRFDQVFKRYQEALDRPFPFRWKSNRTKITLGSVWPRGWRILFPGLLPFLKSKQVALIAVPHEISPDFIESLTQSLEKENLTYVLYSQLKDDLVPENTDVLIVDAVGFLNQIYLISDIAYVGGGFGKGVHNVMEPTVCGQPVFFGPHHENSPEAVSMKSQGVAFCVETPESVENLIKTLTEDPAKRKLLGEQARQFIIKNLGATDKIVNEIEKRLEE